MGMRPKWKLESLKHQHALCIFFFPNNPRILLPFISLHLFCFILTPPRPYFLPHASAILLIHLPSLPLALLICLPCLSVFFPIYLLRYPSLPSPSSPPPPPLSSTCAPAEGEFRGRGNPRGSQAPHRWLANYTFITSLLPLFLWPLLHNDSLFLRHLTYVSSWPVCS